MKYFGFTDLN